MRPPVPWLTALSLACAPATSPPPVDTPDAPVETDPPAETSDSDPTDTPTPPTADCFVDGDGDGFGAGPATPVEGPCEPAGLVAVDGDCADDDPSLHPGAVEVCDGLDQDCHGGPDDDQDGDRHLPCATFGMTAGWTHEEAAEHIGYGYRMAVGDVDADGRLDLLVTAYGTYGPAGGHGLLQVFCDLASGPTTPCFEDRGTLSRDHLGSSLVVADADGDGDDDVVVGRALPTSPPSADVTYGVRWYRGGPGGLRLAGERAAPIPGDGFGAAVAALPDMDGDGRLELVISAPWDDSADEDAGALYRWTWTDTWHEDAPLEVVTGRYHAEQGISLATSPDLDGDGIDDLLIGSNAARWGEIQVMLLAPFGLGASRVERLLPPQQEPGFSTRVVGLGDFDGDGHPDFAAGWPYLPGATDQEGGFVLYRTRPPGFPNVLSNTVPFGLEDAAAGDCLAAAGDVNGDGWPDLTVGASRADGRQVDAGEIHLHLGGQPSSVGGPPDQIWSGGDVRTKRCEAVSVGDLDGDGYGDLVLSLPGAPTGGGNNGRLELWHGGPSGDCDESDPAVFAGPRCP